MPGDVVTSRRCIAMVILVVVLFATVLFMDARNGPAPPDANAIVLVGAGDIADCTDLLGAEATARLLENIPGTVMAVGDLAYPDGTKENFACYDKTWGRVKQRTRPAVGTTSSTQKTPPTISIILARQPASQRMASTATTLVPGTLSR